MANVELDPSNIASLKKLDEVIDQIKGLRKKNLVTAEIARNIAVPFGVLAGNIMMEARLKNEGFGWNGNSEQASNGKASLILSDKAGINTIDTISMVYKTLTSDDDAKSSLNEFYNAFVMMLSML